MVNSSIFVSDLVRKLGYVFKKYKGKKMNRQGTTIYFSFRDISLVFNPTKFSHCAIHLSESGSVAIEMEFFRGDELDFTSWDDVEFGVDPRLNEQGYGFEGYHGYYEFHELEGIYYVIIDHRSIGSYTIYEVHAQEFEWTRLIEILKLRDV